MSALPRWQPLAPHGITGIDHPVIAVRDMHAARKAYERLGFTVPPRGSHLEWGTGNWCIMFERDDLELRGIIDPARYTHGLERFLEAREGLMGVALATDDAEASYRELAQSGLHPAQVRHLTRNFELPEGNVQPRFALCFIDEAETPGLMSVVLCQHITTELLRRPEWMRHANGAQRVSSLIAIVDDLATATRAYEGLFGKAAVSRSDDATIVHMGQHQTILALDHSGASRLLPRAERDGPLKPPCLAAVTLQVGDITATESLFVERKIDFVREQRNSLRVMGKETCGVVLRFSDDGVDRSQ